MRALVIGALVAAARGQAQQPTGMVTGVVFDSVAQTPLAGATVQVASRDSSALLFQSTTDGSGHFRISGIPSGRYVVGFYHDALAALGLDAPRRVFELKAGASARTDLAVPSGGVLRALRCGGDSGTRATGMLAGFVRDPELESVLVEASVAAQWTVVAFDSAHLRSSFDRRTTKVQPDGTYLLCDVPVDAILSIRVESPNRRSVIGDVVVPSTGARRRDFWLADSGAVVGHATLVGHVEVEGGKPVRSGRASVANLAIDVPIQDGVFIMRELPLGTWSIEARANGVEPQSILVDLPRSGETTATITLATRTQLLGPVAVVGKPTRASTVFSEVMLRKRFGAGTVFSAGDPSFDAARQIGDVLTTARGFHSNSLDGASGRQACPSASRPLRGKRLKIYLNGDPFLLELSDLNRMIPIGDVLAIETYPDGGSAPSPWRLDDPCAVLAVWTKRP